MRDLDPAGDIAVEEVALAPATGEDLGFEHAGAAAEGGGVLGGFGRGQGEEAAGHGDVEVAEEGLGLVFVDAEVAALLEEGCCSGGYGVVAAGEGPGEGAEDVHCDCGWVNEGDAERRSEGAGLCMSTGVCRCVYKCA